MLKEYNLKMPHAVYGGENAIGNITAIIQNCRAKRVAMFTDKGIEGCGLFAQCCQFLLPLGRSHRLVLSAQAADPAIQRKSRSAA